MLLALVSKKGGCTHFFKGHLNLIVEHSIHHGLDLDGHIDQSLGEDEANMIFRLQTGRTEEVLDGRMKVRVGRGFRQNIFY